MYAMSNTEVSSPVNSESPGRGSSKNKKGSMILSRYPSLVSAFTNFSVMGRMASLMDCISIVKLCIDAQMVAVLATGHGSQLGPYFEPLSNSLAENAVSLSERSVELSESQRRTPMAGWVVSDPMLPRRLRSGSLSRFLLLEFVFVKVFLVSFLSCTAISPSSVGTYLATVSKDFPMSIHVLIGVWIVAPAVAVISNSSDGRVSFRRSIRVMRPFIGPSLSSLAGLTMSTNIPAATWISKSLR